MPRWSSISGTNIINITKIQIAHILIGTAGGGYAAAKQVESLIAAALKIRGAHFCSSCDGILPACFQTTLDWDKDEKRFSEKALQTSNANPVG